MRRVLVAIVILITAAFWFLPVSAALAQAESTNLNVNIDALDAQLAQPVPSDLAPDTYAVAKVVAIEAEGTTALGGVSQPYQTVKLEVMSGPEKGKQLTVDHGKEVTIRDYQKVKPGQKVVLLKTSGVDGQDTYFIADAYRLPSLGWVFVVFFVLVIFFGRWRGLTSIIGMVVSLLVISSFIIPRILHGANPLGMSLLGAVAIAVISLYVAHGFNRRTSIALGSTLITLVLATGLALLFVSLAKLTGVGTDEAFYLQFGPLNALNLKGLLLGGIIIGALGVLDDITTGQTAAVEEIYKANPALPARELVRRGLSVGREHIASLVNTLVLAYAGASFPLLLLFTMNTTVPAWTTLNSEFVAEEIIRTLVGSSALVLAVPIATVLAAKFIVRKRRASSTAEGRTLGHF